MACFMPTVSIFESEDVMEITKDEFNWADDVLIDVIADSDNPQAERARMIMVMLARTAFDLQAQVSELTKACHQLLDTHDDIAWIHRNDESCACKGCASVFARDVLEKVKQHRH